MLKVMHRTCGSLETSATSQTTERRSAMNRLEHLRRWQAEFERYRSVPLTSTERMRMLWRRKRRLLRYLLSSYGSGKWRPDEGDVAPSDTDAVAVLFESESPIKGKAPKSLGRIRHTLKVIHGANEAPARGPMTGGLWKRSWISVASFKSGRESRFLASLKHQRIAYALVKRGGTAVVQVHRVDSDQAFRLLDELRAELLRRRRNQGTAAATEPLVPTSPTASFPATAVTVLFAVVWLLPTVAAVILGSIADDRLLGHIQLLPGRPGFQGIGLVLGLLAAAVLHACFLTRLRDWLYLRRHGLIWPSPGRGDDPPPQADGKNLHQNP
jgi:hypothetical protein